LDDGIGPYLRCSPARATIQKYGSTAREPTAARKMEMNDLSFQLFEPKRIAEMRLLRFRFSTLAHDVRECARAREACA